MKGKEAAVEVADVNERGDEDDVYMDDMRAYTFEWV